MATVNDKDRAAALVAAHTILAGLEDRKGVGDELDSVKHGDPEIYREIAAAVSEPIARMIADAREQENKVCEIVALGNTCDTNSACSHMICELLHAVARRIRERRIP